MLYEELGGCRAILVNSEAQRTVPLSIDEGGQIETALLALQKFNQLLTSTLFASKNVSVNPFLSSLLALTVTKVVSGTLLCDTACALFRVRGRVRIVLTRRVLACGH